MADEPERTPPVRPPNPVVVPSGAAPMPPLSQQIPPRSPVVATAIPPLYATKVDVRENGSDLAVKFSMGDPFLEELAEEDSAQGRQVAQAIQQMPSTVVAMSKAFAEEVYAKLGEALGK